MAGDCGGWARSDRRVRPGKLIKCPSCNAFSRVERTGENNVAWAKATWSADEADDPTAAHDWSCSWGGAGGNARCHKLVCGERVPLRTSAPLYVTVTLVAVNSTLQPESHSWPIETRELAIRSGTRWTSLASGGSVGRLSSAVCVDCMCVPLGQAMPIGVVVSCRLTKQSESMRKKCAVLPVSAMAVEEDVVGGPTANEVV